MRSIEVAHQEDPVSGRHMLEEMAQISPGVRSSCGFHMTSDRCDRLLSWKEGSDLSESLTASEMPFIIPREFEMRND
jgi:hypothetical protein